MKHTNTHHSVSSELPNWNLKGKKVLVRIDGDVPVKNGIIEDDSRLQDCLPTLELIKAKRGQIILATHIGRPTYQDPELSTQLLSGWFENKGFTVSFAHDLQIAHVLSKQSNSDIILLENLRFNPQEQEPTLAFAQQLSSLADFYIQEAFGTSHRADCSLTLVPKQFDAQQRTVGLHCAHEIKQLRPFTTNPVKPYVAVLGGGKVADKLPVVNALLEKVDKILLCPALVFTFLKAQGISVGLSLVVDDVIKDAQHILDKPGALEKLIFPVDYQVANGTINGALSVITADQFKKDMVGIAIGPNSIPLYCEYIQKAGTVFFNGPMGFIDKPDTMHATCALLTAMGQSTAQTIIGGGDSIEFAKACDVTDKITVLSSGGGACLTYLSGMPLPGLSLFM